MSTRKEKLNISGSVSTKLGFPAKFLSPRQLQPTYCSNSCTSLAMLSASTSTIKRSPNSFTSFNFNLFAKTCRQMAPHERFKRSMRILILMNKNQVLSEEDKEDGNYWDGSVAEKEIQKKSKVTQKEPEQNVNQEGY
jgi:hypothetical protein